MDESMSTTEVASAKVQNRSVGQRSLHPSDAKTRGQIDGHEHIES
jgi:hypothetical protein